MQKICCGISIISWLLLTGFACDKVIQNGEIDGKKQDSMSCTSDHDCSVTPEDCCGCNKGGKQIAIANDALLAHKTKVSGRCAGAMCVQMISHDPSCKKSAVCDAGQCILK